MAKARQNDDSKHIDMKYFVRHNYNDSKFYL